MKLLLKSEFKQFIIIHLLLFAYLFELSLYNYNNSRSHIYIASNI
jgi:hypothetical protein